MARRPKPWFRKARNCWLVTSDGTQHNLGPIKKEAFETFHELMSKPQTCQEVMLQRPGYRQTVN